MKFKTKNFQLNQFLKVHAWQILITASLDIIGVFAALSIPLFLGRMITELEKGNATVHSLFVGFMTVAGLYVIWNVISLLVEVNFEVINKKIENQVRQHCIQKIYHSNFASVLKTSESEIVSKITRDSKAIDKAFINLYKYMFALVNTFVIVLMMLRVNVKISIVLLAIYLFILLLQRIIGGKLKVYFKGFKKVEDSLFEQFHIQLKGLSTTKILQNETLLLKRLNKNTQDTIKSYKQLITKVGIVRYVNYTILGIFRSATIFVGGLFYLTGRVSLGSIFTLYTYVIQLASYLRSLVEVDILIKDMASSLTRLDDFLDSLSSSEFDDKACVGTITEVSFKDVSYKIGAQTILLPISFTAEKGDIVGIRGKNGTGKSTLSYFINGLLCHDGIFLNEMQANQFSPTSHIARVSSVMQNSYLYPDTVYNNLVNFNDSAFERVAKQLNTYGLEAYFKRFGEKYEKMIDDKNLNLSGGERQAISFIRAVSKPHDILILDELENSLDVGSFFSIKEGLVRQKSERITFIITHDESTLQICNKVIDLKEHILENEEDQNYYKVETVT